MADEVFVRTIQPIVLDGTLIYQKQNETSFIYQNDCREKALIRRIRIESHPKNKVSVFITETNDKKTVVEQIEVGSLLPIAPGMYAIEFIGENGLVVDKNQSIIIAPLNDHMDTNTLQCRVFIERDKLKYDQE